METINGRKRVFSFDPLKVNAKEAKVALSRIEEGKKVLNAEQVLWSHHLLLF